jgi:hypothetical protein
MVMTKTDFQKAKKESIKKWEELYAYAGEYGIDKLLYDKITCYCGFCKMCQKETVEWLLLSYDNCKAECPCKDANICGVRGSDLSMLDDEIDGFLYFNCSLKTEFAVFWRIGVILTKISNLEWRGKE